METLLILLLNLSKNTLITISIEQIMTSFIFFFFNDTATTEIYTLSLHDALPISLRANGMITWRGQLRAQHFRHLVVIGLERSEEHTSELQSHSDLVCRLLLEKKK